MREDIFESEEEFEEVMKRVIPSHHYNNEEFKKARVRYASKYNLIKKSPLEEAEKRYREWEEHCSTGVRISISTQGATYIKELEKDNERLKNASNKS